MVSPVEQTPEKPSVDRTLVHNYRVLLVVPREARDRHDRVDPRRQLRKVKKLHLFRLAKRSLLVIKNISQSVHTGLVVAAVHSHPLFPHRRLVSVPRRLIVIRERNYTSAHSQYHTRVNLTMSIFIYYTTTINLATI